MKTKKKPVLEAIEAGEGDRRDDQQGSQENAEPGDDNDQHP